MLIFVKFVHLVNHPLCTRRLAVKYGECISPRLLQCDALTSVLFVGNQLNKQAVRTLVISAPRGVEFTVI